MKKHRLFKPLFYLLLTGVILIGIQIFDFTTLKNPFTTSVVKSLLLVILYIIALSSGIASFLSFTATKTKLSRRTDIQFAIVLIGIILLRFICFYFKFPNHLFNSNLFQVHPFYIQNNLCNLGTLLVDAGLFIIIGNVFFKYYGSYQRFIKNQRKINIYSIISTSIVIILFLLINVTISHIIVNADFIINTNKVLYFNIYSYILFFVFFSYFYAFSLIANKIIKTVIILLKRDKKQIGILFSIPFIIAAVITSIFLPQIELIATLFFIIVLAIYFILVIILAYNKEYFFQFLSIFSNILVFSALMAILLSVYLDKYENNYRVKLVKNIITTDNFYFDKVYNSDRSDITSEYSFAYFVNDQLKEQHGEYKYGYNALNYLLNSEGKEFIELRGYKHFLFRINDKTLIVVSKKTSAYFSKTASYSFFVILFIFYSFAVFIVTNLFTKIRYKKLTFRDRIQWTILGSFLIISIIICALSINLFMKSYGEKYEDMFIGKINSLCNYFNEEKLSFVQTPENRKFLDSKLEELSNIFANEINLYDKNGNLLSSSDYDYFNKNGYAKTLNNTLFDPIFKKKITLYVDKNITYSKLLMMVYKPVFDENGEIRAIFNLNVVAKHDEFKSDLSNLIVQFLSAYAYIILFSIILSWILYLFISKPLGVIGKILNNNNSENKQIKVGWSDNDEIGRLIKEHNRMVEELQKNARKMATSERRTAWREMAQEIAHEIKNPLTPMKLNIQMLQQSWNDKRSDFDGRLEKTTKQLVEQIDVLTKTADLFNEFALSENAINSEENIALILNDFEKSLTNETKIDLLFNYDQNKNYAAFVDKAQFSKMLSYLLNVAIQNQRPHTKLTVSISLSDLNNNFWLLTFADNGKGLNIDSNKDLFSFKFNTEGCISCLRFPIIKNIVIRFGGKISFSTEENVGTEYNILIPKS